MLNKTTDVTGLQAEVEAAQGPIQAVCLFMVEI